MDRIRAVCRLLLFIIVASLTVLGTFIAKPLPRRFFNKWKNTCTSVFAKLIIAIIGMDLKVEGEPPKPPFFMVANHLSYIDVLPIWACCEGTFIAKSEIKSWPFLGFATQAMGVLFIDREENKDIKRVNTLISEQLSPNCGIILFPEGTSTNGHRVLPFKSSLLHYPALKTMPVSYATISYRSFDETKPAERYICWWGDMTFFTHFFEMLKLKSFKAVITFGEEKIVESDRKRLAHLLHQRVSYSYMNNKSRTQQILN